MGPAQFLATNYPPSGICLGYTDLAFTEDVGKRFESYGWRVLTVDGGDDDLDAISKALEEAKNSRDKPTLIKIR